MGTEARMTNYGEFDLIDELAELDSEEPANFGLEIRLMTSSERNGAAA